MRLGSTVDALTQAATPRFLLKFRPALAGTVALSPCASNVTALPPFGRSPQAALAARVAVSCEPDESTSEFEPAAQSSKRQNPLAVTNACCNTPTSELS